MRTQNLGVKTPNRRVLASFAPQGRASLSKCFIFGLKSGIFGLGYVRLTSCSNLRQAGEHSSVQNKRYTRRNRCLRASSPFWRSASLSLSQPAPKSRLMNSLWSTRPQSRPSQPTRVNTSKTFGRAAGQFGQAPAHLAPRVSLAFGGAA